ncbi:asparaginase [Paenibacillus abyssi]|uniref:asparaginase n=1 Tax=Paenibacillus abyssi TaxID=1340531 RepID=A0A917FWF5_9BACL|nr:asparaginase [Paenibacillus abyssi]GGG11388.1 L-asparaginase 1 [Paenibacillus abyssi]
MNRILVVFTGGTIGSKKQNNKIDVDHSISFELLERYTQSKKARSVQFDTMQPFNLLSENLIPDDWAVLFKAISKFDLSDYDGLIITHGTDTLPYTAAALSYIYHACPVPILLIASNYPLNDARSKGLNNFIHAVNFILGTKLPGVYVSFENRKGEALIHLGTRLQQSAPFTDEYESAYSVPLGYMNDELFIRVEHPVNPTMEEIREPRSRHIALKTPIFSNEILYLKPYPGLNYNYLPFAGAKPKAVLHDLYHSGTASTRAVNGEIRYSIVDFIETCTKQDVDIYLCPMKNEGEDFYVTSVHMIQAGAHPLAGITVEAALVKVMLAYGSLQTKQEITDFLNSTSLFFEKMGSA